MDKMLWVAMTGAKEILQSQAVVAHNLANASTQGYRGDLHAFSSYLVQGPGFPTRINAVDESLGFDPRSGTLQQTGRDLDIAITTDGWIAVQGPDGTEGYTRAGNLRVTAAGVLETATGHPVLGEGGPVLVPEYQQLLLGDDGTVSVVPKGLGPEALATVGRIKLVNPPAEQLAKGADGLLRLKDGSTAPPDAAVRTVSGLLESSNVNVAEVLVEMITMARQYEMQVKTMAAARETDQASSSLLRMQ